jgi:hypothetical protein
VASLEDLDKIWEEMMTTGMGDETDEEWAMKVQQIRQRTGVI